MTKKIDHYFNGTALLELNDYPLPIYLCGLDKYLQDCTEDELYECLFDSACIEVIDGELTVDEAIIDNERDFYQDDNGDWHGVRWQAEKVFENGDHYYTIPEGIVNDPTKEMLFEFDAETTQKIIEQTEAYINGMEATK